MKDYLSAFFDEFDYPQTAREQLTAAYDEILANKEAAALFDNALDSFPDIGDSEIFAAVDGASELAGVHKYTGELLYFNCLSKRVLADYEKAGLPREIWHDSMADMKWKLIECMKMYGFAGSFVAWWFPGFMRLNRFALGRLQFETSRTDRAFDFSCRRLEKGANAINMHIPSAGPLKHELCVDAYKRAREFFTQRYGELFGDGSEPTAFVCHSWLLYPDHYDFLPQNSNIRTFMDDFFIYDSYEDESGDKWRIFYADSKNPPDKLPRGTSLQRAYADRLASGGKTGGGHGVFLFDGENIINKGVGLV